MSIIFRFPPTTPIVPTPSVEVSGGALDHVARAISRLPWQFRTKPKIVSLLTALVTPLQEIENAFIDLLLNRTIDNAFGVTLDAIGNLVGQLRAGLVDADYRRYLRARIAANRSNGNAEDIIRITRLIVVDPAMTVKVTTEGIATTDVKLLGIVPAPALADILISFLRKAAAAGVRLILETLTDVDDESFTLAIAAFNPAPLTIGMTTIAVGSTDGFPSSGTLDIDIGLAVAEQATYTGKTSNSFIDVSPLAHAHVAGSAVQLADGPGKGLGDDGNPATGGKLAAARQ